jgi:hypothetical protein
MKWTVKLERIEETDNLRTTTVGYLERPELSTAIESGAGRK